MKKNKNQLTGKQEEIADLFRSLIKSLDTLVVILDEGLCVQAWNSLAQEYMGFSEEEVQGLSLTDMNSPEYIPTLMEALETCRFRGEVVHLPDIRWKDKEGNVRYLGMKIVPLKIPEYGLAGFMLNGKDVTRIREMNFQQEEGQKFRAIGKLAAGIAHEINTPLQFVQNNLIYLQGIMKEMEEMAQDAGFREKSSAGQVHPVPWEEIRDLLRDCPEAIRQSLEGTERITKLVKSLQNYSHPGTGKPEIFDLTNAVRDSLNLTVNEWKNTATVEFEPPEVLPKINGYPSQVSQALVNMIINACYSLRQKFGPAPLGQGKIRIFLEEAGEFIRMTITDNGKGMTDEVRSRVFEPFFTTKPRGEGTGQGLAQVYSCFVHLHKGKIQVDSVPEEGTIFRIELPEE